MKEYFEDAYETVMDLPTMFAEFGKDALNLLGYILIYITLPIWVLPYSFYRNSKKGGDKE